ncbi:MAG: helix-turn-helix domain-containing protein [Eubacterium sp.]|nr:helix-turn-helix domain-containing protein [Eubacterium sp.]
MTEKSYNREYEEDFNRIFARNLRKYLADNNMTQLELAKKLGVGTTSVYNWCNGIKTPRISKVDAMCSLFHCRRSDLMEDKSTTEQLVFEGDKEILFEIQKLNSDNLKRLMHYIKLLRSFQENPNSEIKDDKE